MMLLIFTAVFATFVAQEAVAIAPEIISRAQWGARPPSEEISDLSIKPAPYVIIHHSDTAGCNTQAVCQSRVRGFQNYHMDTKGWSDIGYNFVIGGDGSIYEGRGWDKRGAHSKLFNSKSIGICIIGNYTTQTPPRAAIQATGKLITYGTSIGEIENDYKLLGHRQTAQTTCPGDELYEMIRMWPHWSEDA